jgi:7,8-dihydro-6-hydroxymethylpterin-pyrophosphokinase
METEALTIPHPRIVERAFVLRPLLDLDAELVHPVTGERLEAVLRAVGDEGLVVVARPGWEAGDKPSPRGRGDKRAV